MTWKRFKFLESLQKCQVQEAPVLKVISLGFIYDFALYKTKYKGILEIMRVIDESI